MPHPDSIRLILSILAGISLIAMLWKPFFGLICYLIVMMIQPGLYYPELKELRVEFFVGVIILVVILLSPGRLQRIRFKENDIIKWMFILYGVMILSMVQAMDIDISWEWVYDFSKIFFFFIMIITLIDNERDIKVFFLIYGLVTCALAYDAIFNYFAGNIIKSLSETRTDYAVAEQGIASGHVALANLTLQGIPAIWYLAVNQPKVLLKIIGIFLFILCLYALVISGSRGGFIGLIVLWILLIYFSKTRFLLISLGVLTATIFPFFSQSNYMDVVLKPFTGNLDMSGESRFTGLINGFEMLIRRPLLGVGPGCYPVARKAWLGWGLWAHNHYGELMGDLGITGTVVWFIFLKKYYMSAWNIAKANGENGVVRAICYTVIVTTLLRLFLGMATHSVYIFIWYMLAGIVVVINRLNLEGKANLQNASALGS